MVSVTLRFDEEMKKQLDELCDDLGMNLTTFFMIYAKKALKTKGIPFRVSSKDNDPFYSASNMNALKESFKQYEEGRIVHKTLEELEKMTSD